MAKPTRSLSDTDKEEVVVLDNESPVVEAGEELVRVEAISDGTYPDLLDPRREPWYAIYRTGRAFAGDNGQLAPGEVFMMKASDAASAVHEKGNPYGWVRILKDGELPEHGLRSVDQVPSTTAPRGYGQGRRPGLPQR